MLPDGSVLFTGGDGANGPLQSAEVFGVNGTVSSAVAMNVARSRHFAVVLSDGRVLVGGGNTTGGGATNSAEIYDPNANTWTQTAPMTSARANATAALLQDGHILIAGGDNAGAPNNTLETYDPASGNFSFAGTLSSPHTQHAMSVLQDGRVLIVGGFDGNNPVASSDIFDPASGSVSAGPSLAAARYAASATTLMNGQVAVIGGAGQGSNGTVDLASIEIYDPTSGAFADAGVSLTTARQGHQAFLLPNNNSVLIVGGTASGAALASAETFTAQASTADGSWSYAVSATGSMITGRANASGSANQTNGPTSTVTPKPGLLIVGGGADASGTTLAATEAYGYPTVQTDQGDYPPGSTVNIQGSGFKPGESVSITLIESPLIDTHGPYIVTADGNGNFSDSSFATDIHDVNVRFWLSAVGSQSGVVAQNTFTDANPNALTLGSQTPVPILAGASSTYSVSVTFNGNGTSCTVDLTATATASPAWPAPPAGGFFNFVSSSLTSTGATQATLLTVNTPAAMSANTYNFTVKATPRAGTCQNNPQTLQANGSLVVAGPATHLSVSGFSSPVTAGTAGDFTVTALDANNNTAVGFTGTVNFSSSDSQATFSPSSYTFVTGDKGTHTFTNGGTLRTAGTQSITAAASGLASGTQSGITVNAGATAQLAVTGYLSPVTAGASNSFTVTAEDSFGNLTTGYTGTVHFTSSDGAAVLPGNHNFTSGTGNKDNGVATFNATLNTAGTQSITATDTGTPSIMGTQSGILVNSATVATSLALGAPSPASVQFGSAGPVTFAATLTRTTGGAAVSGATISFTVDGNSAGSAVTNGSGVATLSTYNPSALSVGNHNVQASFAGQTISGTTYSSGTSGTQTLAVTQASQIITFGALGNKIYGDAAFTVSATGGASGNPVTFTASPAGVCTSGATNGSTITIAGAGSCTVTAQQAGNTNYTAATDVSQSFTVSPAMPTVVVTPYSVTYDGHAHTAAVTSITGVNGETGATVGTVDVSNTTHTNAGTYASDSWSFTGTANYNNIAATTITDSIAKANATVVVTPYSVTYTGTAHTATGTAKGVLNESLAGLDLSGTTHTSAGDYPSDPWTFTDSTGNYNNSNGTVHDHIDKADAVISVTPYSVTYTGTAHTATGTAKGVLNESLAGLDLSGTTHTSAGDYPSDPWTFTDSTGNYNNSNGTVHDHIDKADAVISVTPYSVTYTGTAHTATGTAKGVLNESLAGLDLSGTTHTSAGDYPSDPWTFTDSTGNYNNSNGTVHDHIDKADAVISVTPYSVTYTGTAHTATGTAKGVLNESLAGLDLSGTTHTSAGDYPSDPWTFTDSTGNYNNSNGTVHDHIDKADAVISVTPYSVTYTGTAHTATGTAKGVLNESLAGLDLSGTTHTSAGDYPSDPWTFTDSTGNYNNSNGTVHDHIDKATPAVVWTTPADIVYGTALSEVQLNASFTGVGNSVLPGVATYIPPAGTVLNAGNGQTLSVTFVPTDTTNYNNADKSVSINVLKATPTVNWANPANIVYGTALSGTQLNATFTWVVAGAGISVPGTATYNPASGTVLNPGTQTLSVSFVPTDSGNYNNAAQSVSINVMYGTCNAAIGPGQVILPPINSDGTSVYQRKGGSTIPVKFRVCSANGMPIPNANLVFAPMGGTITLLGAVRGTIDNVNEGATTDVPDVAFRWDSSGQQWIFNMATSNLTSGSTYQFRINLANASQSILFVVGVK